MSSFAIPDKNLLFLLFLLSYLIYVPQIKKNLRFVAHKFILLAYLHVYLLTNLQYHRPNFSKELITMPNIKPVSDLRNYTDVLKEVDVSSRVYLTMNGHGEYAILTMDEIDELDRLKAAYALLSDLQNAEDRANKEGWISQEDIDKEFGL